MSKAVIEVPKAELITPNPATNLTSNVKVEGNNNTVNEFVNQQTNIYISLTLNLRLKERWTPIIAIYLF